MTSTRAAKESLRESLIEALSYPRKVMRNYIELDNCPHNGLYDSEDGNCLACPQQMECVWLYSNEEFAALEKKPIAEILAALEDGLEYVTAQISYLEHDS